MVNSMLKITKQYRTCIEQQCFELITFEHFCIWIWASMVPLYSTASCQSDTKVRPHVCV